MAAAAAACARCNIRQDFGCSFRSEGTNAFEHVDAEPRGKAMVLNKPAHVIRELIRVEWVKNKAAFAGRDHLSAARVFRTQHRLPECHSLQYRDAPSIGAARRDKDICRVVVETELIVGHSADLTDDAIKLVILDRFAQIVLLLAGAYK